MGLFLRSVRHRPNFSLQNHVNIIRTADGEAGLSHPEERMERSLEGRKETRICNIRTNFEDKHSLQQVVRNPVMLTTAVIPAVRRISGQPADHLRHRDQLHLRNRLTVSSANDTCQNAAVSVLTA